MASNLEVDLKKERAGLFRISPTVVSSDVFFHTMPVDQM